MRTRFGRAKPSQAKPSAHVCSRGGEHHRVPVARGACQQRVVTAARGSEDSMQRHLYGPAEFHMTNRIACHALRCEPNRTVQRSAAKRSACNDPTNAPRAHRTFEAQGESAHSGCSPGQCAAPWPPAGGIRSCALTFCALMTPPRLRRSAAAHVRPPEGRAARAHATEHDAMQRPGRGAPCPAS